MAMAQRPATRQSRTIFMYMFFAIPLTVVVLFLINPGLSTRTKDYVSGIVHSSGLTGSNDAVLDTEVVSVSAAVEDAQVTPIPTPEPEAPAPEEPASEEPASEESAAEEVAPEAPTDLPTTNEEPAPTTSQSSVRTATEPSTGASRSPFPTETETVAETTSTEPKPPKKTGFNDDRWWFQNDLDEVDYPLPKFDLDKLQYLAPHNYRGLNKETYATYYGTRNGTVHDPFFIGALQVVYRLLWDQRSKSEKHPVTVFVAPFVPEEQRKYFAAAGALVRELSLIEFTPDGETFGRWRDMFSKLEMWRQLDFSRIAYMDSDAFPVNKTDAIFDVVKEKTCKPEKLPNEDKPFASTICKYAWAGALEAKTSFFQGVNAGVMVFKPNRAMYARLTRAIHDDKHKWDTTYMEQGYLNYMYRKNGPFPFQSIPKAYNAPPDFRDKGKEHFIVHDKMWAHIFDDKDLWVVEHYKQTWRDMIALYESEDFVRIRNEDQELMMADLG